ncbi:MAG: lipopolysaccharide biosynthesis protein [Pedobacter sp.]
MEEINLFLRLLKKYLYILIIIPIIAVIVTFFLVRNLPDTYLSMAQISTGIVDETQNVLLTKEEATKTSEVSQKFANLVEVMRLKKLLDQVSYQLIIHDLTSSTPYRKRSKLITSLPKSVLDNALRTYKENFQETQGLNLWNKEQSVFYEILRSMDYDSESLKSKLRIGRAGDSDFINIEYESENPELSAFVANTLSSEFIKYYTVLVKTNQLKANKFLGNLLAEKKMLMNQSVQVLRNYKVTNRVLNLDEQSGQLYEQILLFGNRRQEALEGIAAKGGALRQIDSKFNPKERGYLESTLTKVNQDIMGTREDLRNLYDLYIDNDFEPGYKRSIDSLQQVLGAQINSSTDQFIYNPLVSKQALVEQKLRMEIELDLAKYGMNSMQKQLKSLNSQFDELVPHEADVQSMERDVEVASKEYLDVLDKFNQSSLESAFSVRLKLLQQAMPGLAQPSKKMLLVILSGMIAFAFCILIIFILFFIDNKIRTPKDLANKSKLPVLGFLKSMKGSIVDLEKIWRANTDESILRGFKNQLRSIRFEIENDFKEKVLVITSLKEGEGKSLLTLSLAYAWKMTNKRILIIDGNFKNPKISNSITPTMYLEDYFTGNTKLSDLVIQSSFEFMANRGGDLSIFEIVNETVIKERLDDLRTMFDIIIIETAALDQLNLSKEWILFGDRVVGVFEANQSLNEEKKQNIGYLEALGNRFSGWILNKVPVDKVAKGI